MYFFGSLAFFALLAVGLSSCSRLRGTQGARPDPACKFGPWPRSMARALGVRSRKSARGGIPSTYSLQALENPHGKIMSDVSCNIWDLECHHCRQTILTW